MKAAENEKIGGLFFCVLLVKFLYFAWQTTVKRSEYVP